MALRKLGEEGIGTGRGRFEVEDVESGGAPVYRGGAPVVRLPAPEAVAIEPDGARDTRVAVEFVTPTALKHEGALVRRPDFHVLVRRIRDRLNALSTFFGAGPLAWDFSGMAERAAAVRLVADSTRWREVTRRSTRTREWHEISGLLGRAVYEGPVGEFLPLLRAAERVHVGRHAAFGNGWVRVGG